MGIKSLIKRYNFIYKPASSLRKLIRHGLSQIQVFVVAVRRGTLFSNLTTQFNSKKWGNQAFMEYTVPFPPFEGEDGLIQFLNDSNVEYSEGRWTVYLPPQETLAKLIPFLAQKYPSDAGLKILKAFGHPNSTKYVTGKYVKHPSHPFSSADIPQLIRIANYLHLYGIGPRLYDVVSMKYGTNTSTSFVIQHIDSEPLYDTDFDKFMDNLDGIFSKGDIIPSIQSWQTHKDFEKPNCNNNLVRRNTDGKLYYVDFQSFMFKNEKQFLRNIISRYKNNLHFGSEVSLLGGRFLYQSVPGFDHGRRDTERRWEIFLELLNSVGMVLHDKVIFDICCNAGMILYNCLVNGAFWGVGWDLPEVAEVANTLQSGLGMTRIDIFGEKINDDTDFLKDLPTHLSHHKDCILFYLAAKKHIGFPEGVGKLPWTTMIYEGHANEDFEATKQFFSEVPWLRDVEVRAMTTNKSELGIVRTIALLTREYSS